MNAYALVELGKKKQMIASDRAFAIKIGVTSQNISDWKAGRATPNATKFLKLAVAAGMNIEEALEYAESMEKSKFVKEAGFTTVKMLGTLGAISGLTLAATSHLPYEALAAGLACVSSVHYVKSDGNLIIVIRMKDQPHLRTWISHDLFQTPAANDAQFAVVPAYRIH
ncbi:helix-turn-helix domain-containing protein [Methylobacillus sp. Pita1]|uniref:helix-turn-helix domain-containing protein n=1 Tax=Methylobacillus sp. Pita1 TaxID=3382642 RepID=UPI0038B4CD2C